MSDQSQVPMGRFEIPNCVVPRRFTSLLEKFLLDKRTGNVRLNIKDGKLIGIHVEEIVLFPWRDTK